MRKLTCPRGWQTSGVNQSLPGLSPRVNTKHRFTKYLYCNVLRYHFRQVLPFVASSFFLHGRITPSVQPDLKPVMADQRGDALSMCHDWCNPQKWHATKTMTHVTTTKNGDLIQYYLTSSPFWLTKCSSPQTKIEQYFQDPIVDDVFSIISRFSASSLRGC